MVAEQKRVLNGGGCGSQAEKECHGWRRFQFFFCFQRLLGFKSHNIVEFTQSGEKIVEKRK